MRRQSGFTLVELVMVIVLLGIVATISTQFVALSTRGAIDVGDRQQRALAGVVISEQITREVREAFPLSVRRSSECLEWIPTLGATAYTGLPVGAGGNTVAIEPFGDDIPADNVRLIVYGYGTSQDSLYNWSSLPNPGPVSPEIAEDITPGKQEITLNASHRFKERSPQKRIYAVGQPTSVCQATSTNSSRLYRFTDYPSLGGGVPTYSWLVSNADDSDIINANLAPGTWETEVTPISLSRAAVVNFAFVLASRGSDETTRVSQEVQVRNVP